jgi:competence ComEA-like helix-hairpin-helix protein
MGPSTIAINTASAEEIAQLYGIGPGLAERVVESREAEGFFAGPEDLARVKGISHRRAKMLAPQIDWTLPSIPRQQNFRDSYGAMRWAILAVILAIASWPLIGAIGDVVDLMREGFMPTAQGFVALVGCSVGLPCAVLWALLRAISCLDSRRRLVRRAADLLFIFVLVMLLPAIVLLIWNDLWSEAYKTESQARARLFVLAAAATTLIPLLLRRWRSSLVGGRFVTYWLNAVVLLQLLALLKGGWWETAGSSQRIGVAVAGVLVLAETFRQFLHRSRRPPPLPEVTTPARSGRRWTWLGWPGWAGVSGLVGVAALLITVLGLPPDPVGLVHRNPELPRLVDEIPPSGDWYTWLRFFETNESRQVYLDLRFSLESGVDANGLLPAERTRARSLQLRACEPEIVDSCTNIIVTVLADSDVEEHVFFSGADPDGRIRGHFIVDEYFTQMSLVEIRLKPISIVDVKEPVTPRVDE